MGSINRVWAFGLVILTTLLITLAQLLLKTGLGHVPKILTNPYLLGGVALYAIGSGVMLLAFKGGEVSVLYPVIATSYIWVVLVSHFVLAENVHPLRWLGVAVIVTGISLIGLAGRGHAGIEHQGVP